MKDDPKSALQEAIAKLKQFNAENAPTDDSSLQKTIALMRILFKGKHPAQKGLKEVKKAVDILKSHHRLIEKLSEGTPQEQKLAASAVATIAQYNTIIDISRQRPKSLNARINHFLLKEKSGLSNDLSKITLPKATSFQVKFQEGSVATLKASQLGSFIAPKSPQPQPNVPHLCRQAIELFHMKAISLIERHGLLSNSDARTAIRKGHLQSHVNAETSQCSVFCTVSPFPGHTILISGLFEKSPKDETYVLPKNDSFHLTLTASHSGFPYPVQYTGWALSDLVPAYPHCLEDLPLFKPFYEHKLAIAQQLQPGQEGVARAKNLIACKREEVLHHKDEYITLQQELWTAIAAASSAKGISESVQEAITRFFLKLRPIHSFYDYYAETVQLINHHFVERPLAALEGALLEKVKTQPALAILGKEVENVQRELLQQQSQAQSELEKNTFEFILRMGTVLATPCHRILLQHFSEMRFTPPMLDDFEQKLQTALYRQLQAFLSELESGEPVDLMPQIRDDIALFQATSFESLEEKDPAAHVVNELEGYFNSRYYAMLN